METVGNVKMKSEQIKNTVLQGKGALNAGHASYGSIKESILVDLESAVAQLRVLRTGFKDTPSIEISLGDYVNDRWGFASLDAFYHTLGIDPTNTTLTSLATMPEFTEHYKWLRPEVVREAIKLGLNKNPMYPSITAIEQNVNMPTVILPSINMSDAVMTKVGEAETIPVGSVSFNSKTVLLSKVATGITISDEVKQFVKLNILSTYIQDVGVALNLALDAAAVDVLINGDQADGSNAVTVVGVDNVANGITYDKDLLKVWVKMGMLGRLPTSIVSNDEAAYKILALPEFKGYNGILQKAKLNLNTAIPSAQDYFINGNMPNSNQLLMVDKKSAIIKLNATALLLENERIARSQETSTFASITVGFANLMNDGRLFIDGTSALVDNPYPANFTARVVNFK